jgi:hypothetical protein
VAQVRWHVSKQVFTQVKPAQVFAHVFAQVACPAQVFAQVFAQVAGQVFAQVFAQVAGQVFAQVL